MNEHQLLCSYTPNAYISTCWRRTVTIEGEEWYFETAAFEYDLKEKKLGKMIKQRDSGADEERAFQNHCKVISEILFSKNEDNE